jgi:hypothetical protein
MPGRQLARAVVHGEVAVGVEPEQIVGATVTFVAADRPVDVEARVPGVGGREADTTVTCELLDGDGAVLDTAVFTARQPNDRSSLHLEHQVHPGAGEVTRWVRVRATNGGGVVNEAGLSAIIIKAIER